MCSHCHAQKKSDLIMKLQDTLLSGFFFIFLKDIYTIVTMYGEISTDVIRGMQVMQR